MCTSISNDNISRFESLFVSVEGDGIDKLLRYIKNKTDFYSAPASTRYHMACEGGLLQHSLNVYDCLMAKKESPIWKPILEEIPDESLIIISLLHDLCKANVYEVFFKNQKTYDEEKVAAANPRDRKHDQKGDYIWEVVDGYQFNDKMPLGHGEKSALLVQNYIHLTKPEVMAIRWHMGFSDNKDNNQLVGNAMEYFPIVLALYEADMEASKILEADLKK